MSATDRQNRLLLAEDWKRIYQSFRNADFQSYDFDNLRRTMINYLRQNYPEDFNDYIESSEYLALIDLIAFLGQNISFRIDLNARDNFLELAERRESVLRLARLLSYNVKRNQASNGMLKFSAIKTSEQVTDSNGLNLAGQTVVWNDPSNTNWNEQFTKILNAALPVNNVFGKPNKKDTVNSIPTEQYRFNATNIDVPIYNFKKPVQGKQYPFEVVSTDIEDSNIIEDVPIAGSNFGFIYQNDGKGAGSNNTGFFAHFRQGTLDQGDFTITTPTSNQTISIDTPNINDSDVWLFKLDNNGAQAEYWTKIENLEGNNIIYNSVNKKIRTVYSALTRVDDRVNLIFSDGVFGDLPKGTFRVYYRTSANQRLTIKPSDMIGANIEIPYLSRSGIKETLTITFNLKYTINNGATSESSESIKQNAPATYYTQNRMITAEDYNVAPLAVSQEIVKSKAVNRTASGISRYYDLIDATGKYSKTNLYGADGIIYKEALTSKTGFSFQNQTDIEGVILNVIEPILRDRKLLNFYYNSFPKRLATDLDATFVQNTQDTNRSTGYFQDADGVSYAVGGFTNTILKFVAAGAVCKFTAPAGSYFDKNNYIVSGTPSALGDKTYIWTKVISVNGNGKEVSVQGVGPIVFNDIIPPSAILTEIKPKFNTGLTNDVKTQVIDQAFNYNTFGLRYDVNSGIWRVIIENNLDVTDTFSTGKTGDTTNQSQDASWLLLFNTDGENYTITYRGLRYLFESDEEIKFYYDSSDKIYDSKTGKIIKDKISVLNINPQEKTNLLPFTRNFDWEIIAEYRDKEGYVDSKKIEVGFFDSDDDGVVDDLEIFNEIVNENNNPNTKFIFLKKYIALDSVEDFRYVNQSQENILIFDSETAIDPLSSYNAGQVFYFVDSQLFKVLANDELALSADYKAYIGRDELKFQYIHAADNTSRIDPSSSNIIDVYFLTKAYDTQFRLFLDGAIASNPLPPSSDSLYRNYNNDLEKIKSISDEIIYHPVKYKILFGSSADTSLQAVFKIVKNPDLVLNDNNIKTRVITAINQYFALENWEFGETFYFSELATYVVNQLAPDLVTLVVVPVQVDQSFGSLFEIKSESDEIFISGANVDNIEIIDGITATKLQATGQIITTASSSNTGVTSSALSSSSNIGGVGY
jgi:hypothetical protein